MGLELPVFQPVASPQDQAFLVEVGFKGMRKGFFTCTDPGVRVNDWVLVEVERGRDVGRVRSLGGVAQKKCGSCTPFAPTRSACAAKPGSACRSTGFT
jgi:hypothetical protein